MPSTFKKKPQNTNWFCAFPFFALSDPGSAMAKRLAPAEKNKVQGNWILGNFPWMAKCLLYFVAWHCCYQETNDDMKTLKMEKEKKKKRDVTGMSPRLTGSQGSFIGVSRPVPWLVLACLFFSPPGTVHCQSPELVSQGFIWNSHQVLVGHLFAPVFVQQSSAFPHWVLGENKVQSLTFGAQSLMGMNTLAYGDLGALTMTMNTLWGAAS